MNPTPSGHIVRLVASVRCGTSTSVPILSRRHWSGVSIRSSVYPSSIFAILDAARCTSSCSCARRRAARRSAMRGGHCFRKPGGPKRRFNAARTAPPLPTVPSPVGSLIVAARSPSHAPSRRLQRVSVSCARISRGQPPRRPPVSRLLAPRPSGPSAVRK